MNLPKFSHQPGEAIQSSTLLTGNLWPCLLLILGTLLAYWPVKTCDFVNYDDTVYFTDNPHVLAGLTVDNVKWAFSTGSICNWHPLTWLSLMLDETIFGQGPAGPHIINLLFHLANTLLLFSLCRGLALSRWQALFVAALFAMHPLHVESVAWISERKDVLSAFFALASLIFYVRYARCRAASTPRPIALNYGLSLLLFALGLMSKPMLVTLPFLMLLLDWCPLERIAGLRNTGSEKSDPVNRENVARLLIEKWPFFVLSVASSIVTFLVQQKGGAVVTLVRIPMAGRLENVFVSYARYLGKTIWPFGLAIPYPHPGQWPVALVVVSTLLIAGITVAVVLHKKRFVAMGWLWFMGMLFPVIGLVQTGGQSMADRYTYLASIGLFFIPAILARELGLRWAGIRTLIIGLAILTVTACAWRTRVHVACWKNTEALFLHAMDVTTDNIVACNKLGSFYANHGRVAEAMKYYDIALKINPDDPDVLYDLGNACAQQGDWDSAITHYRHALRFNPNQADVLNNLGLALAAKRQFAEAIGCFQTSLQLDATSADTHNNFAAVLFREHRFDEAVQQYREALRITPDDPRIYANLGDALVRLGKANEAVPCYQSALRLDPGNAAVEKRLRALNNPAAN